LFKIAEVDILRIPLSDEQLVYAMVVERTRNCSELICSKAGNNVLLTINKHLVLIQQKKNLVLENNVFECVDYIELYPVEFSIFIAAALHCTLLATFATSITL